MNKFAIYDKNGNVRHASVTGQSGDGGQVFADSLEYHGTWMADCYVNVGVKSAYPVDFQIGDYIIYRGEKFILATDPSVVKKARRGSYGEGFEYSNIKFSSHHVELDDVRCQDYVLADNELHFTTLPEFSFYAATVEDYADRMQANTNRWCEENGFVLADYWLFITPNKSRFIQRASTLRKNGSAWEGLDRDEAAFIWDNAYPNGTDTNDEKTGIQVSISDQSVWETLKNTRELFGLNFITRGRKAIIGTAGLDTNALPFEYGKGNGLYEIERHPDSEQKLVTKLFAYGSDKNMPLRYYNNVNKSYCAYVKDVNYLDEYGRPPHGGHLLIFSCNLDITFRSKYFTHILSAKKSDGSPYYSVVVRINDHDIACYVSISDDGSYCELGVVDPRLIGKGSEYAQIYAILSDLRPTDRIEFIKYIDKDEWPSDHYSYSNVDAKAYSNVASISQKEYSADEYLMTTFTLDAAYNSADYLIPSVMQPYYCVRLTIGSASASGYIGDDGNGNCLVRVAWFSEDIESRANCYEYSQAAAVAFYNALASGAKVYISGVNTNSFPTVERDYDQPDLPDKMSVKKLMLPGFPTMSLYDWIVDSRYGNGTAVADERNSSKIGRATWHGFDAFFSKEALKPFILSKNFTALGVKECCKNFDGSNDTKDIYPTIEDSGLDIISHAEIVEDSGLFAKAPDPVPTIKLTLPLIDDLDEVWNDGTLEGGTPSVSLKDGYCGGRNLTIKKVEKENDLWLVTCERAYDESIGLYFPYSYNASRGIPAVADEAYQVRGSDINGYDGDHFVLVGIPMPKSYVDGASVRLLKEALEFLSNNDYTRYTYIPKIDDLFMARDHAEASSVGGQSLYDTIKEGDLLRFADSDLLPFDIDKSVFIDTLSIKENGNNGIPTFEITLRNTKEDTPLQNMQKQIRYLTTGGSSSAPASSSMSPQQVRGIIDSELSEEYLKASEDDEARGLIGFLKGVWFGVKERWFITGEGDATLHDMNVNTVTVASSIQAGDIKSPDYTGEGVGDSGFRIFKTALGKTKLVIDELYVRIRAVFESLEVKQEKVTGGNQVYSCAANIIARTDYYDAEDNLLGYEDVDAPFLARALAVLSSNFALARNRKVRVNLPDTNDISYIRCYFLAEDNGRKVNNLWSVTNGHDLARCQTFNMNQSERNVYIDGVSTKVGNVFWWRKVVGVSSLPVEIDGKKYHYFDVSMSDRWHDGNVDSDIPCAGDEVSQWGNDANTDRMNLKVVEVNGTDAPADKWYRGIYTFDMTKCYFGGNPRKEMVSAASGIDFNAATFKLSTESGSVPVPHDIAEDWSEQAKSRAEYAEAGVAVGDLVYKNYYYDRLNHNGSLWLCTFDGNAYWARYAKYENNTVTYVTENEFNTLEESKKLYVRVDNRTGLDDNQVCRRRPYTSDEPSSQSGNWIEQVSKGSSITKVSESYRYATNNTGVRPAASSQDWSTTKPTLQQGYWLYIETTITWSDNTTTVLYTDERNPNDGNDGVSIIPNPYPVFLTQKNTDNATTSFGLPIEVGFIVKEGDSTKTVTRVQIGQGTPTGLTVTPSSDEKKAKITAVVASNGVYPSKGSFTAIVSYTSGSTTKTISSNVQVYIDLKGSFKVEVEGDVESAVAHDIGYSIDPNGNVDTLAKIGTFIRSSSELASKLEKTVVAKNYMPSSGYTNVSGKVSQNFDEEQQSFLADIYTPCMVLPAGTYCLSMYASAAPNAARRILAFSGNSKPEKPSSVSPEVSINMSAVNPAESYDGMTRYKATFTLSDKSYVFIKVGPPTGGTAAHAQLEEVASSSDNPTLWEWGAKYYTSLIKQTAEEIEELVEDTGVDIVNGLINLYADKVKFYKNKTSAQAGDPAKIWIDGENGSLHAVDGEFDGTVRARNLFRSLAVSGGSDYNGVNAKCVTMMDSDTNVSWIYVLRDVSESKYGHAFTAGQYLTNKEFEELVDPDYAYAWKDEYEDFCVCTGPADEVLLVNPTGSVHSGYTYIPRCQDMPGKTIIIRNNGGGVGTTATGTIKQVDGASVFIPGVNLIEDNNGDYDIDSGSTTNISESITTGQGIMLYSTGTVWSRLSKFYNDIVW